jgi:hypothetical protein
MTKFEETLTKLDVDTASVQYVKGYVFTKFSQLN